MPRGGTRLVIGHAYTHRRLIRGRANVFHFPQPAMSSWSMTDKYKSPFFGRERSRTFSSGSKGTETLWSHETSMTHRRFLSAFPHIFDLTSLSQTPNCSMEVTERDHHWIDGVPLDRLHLAISGMSGLFAR